MKIQLLHMPNCPLTDRVRTRLHGCLEQVGVSVVVEESEGRYPSPTLLIDGVDVMGQPAEPSASCRLDVPTQDRILAVLRERARQRAATGENRKGIP